MNGAAPVRRLLGKVMTPSFMKQQASSDAVAGMPEEKAIDLAAMHSRKEAGETPVDDGSGKLKVWRIEDFKKANVPEEKYGQFYGGDSYVLLYTYMSGPREECKSYSLARAPMLFSLVLAVTHTLSLFLSPASIQRRLPLSPSSLVSPLPLRPQTSFTSGRVRIPRRTKSAPAHCWPRSWTTRWAASRCRSE